MAAFATPGELTGLLQRDVDVLTATLALDMASGAIRSACGWNITQETAAVAKASGDGWHVWLPTLRLTTVTSVVEDGVTVAPSEYVVRSYGALLRTTQRWVRGVDNITVTFDHGYTTAPPVAKAVCLSAALRLVTNPEGLRAWTLGGESQTSAGSGPDVIGVLTAGEREQLGPLSLPLVA